LVGGVVLGDWCWGIVTYFLLMRFLEEEERRY
jgi:hypothetical protein